MSVSPVLSACFCIAHLSVSAYCFLFFLSFCQFLPVPICFCRSIVCRCMSPCLSTVGSSACLPVCRLLVACLLFVFPEGYLLQLCHLSSVSSCTLPIRSPPPNVSLPVRCLSAACPPPVLCLSLACPLVVYPTKCIHDRRHVSLACI